MSFRRFDATRVSDEQTSVSADHRLPHVPRAVADWLVVAFAAPYIALNTVFPGPALTYALGMALALTAVGVLLLSGTTPSELFLRVAIPSRQGALLLALLLIFIPGALLAGRGQPPDALKDLVYAPASALAQELYFRSALLCAFTHLLAAKRIDAPSLAIALQAALFAVWHVRAFEATTLLPALAVLALTFIAGIIWGAVAQRDRMLVWCALEHALFLTLQ